MASDELTAFRDLLFSVMPCGRSSDAKFGRETNAPWAKKAAHIERIPLGGICPQRVTQGGGSCINAPTNRWQKYCDRGVLTTEVGDSVAC